MGKRFNSWHENHDKYLTDNYSKKSGPELAKGIAEIEPKVVRSLSTIYVRLSKLNLTDPDGTKRDKFAARGITRKTSTGCIHRCI